MTQKKDDKEDSVSVPGIKALVIRMIDTKRNGKDTAISTHARALILLLGREFCLFAFISSICFITLNILLLSE